MQFDQLRALLAVVDEGTFDRAAARLRVSPSAVSQRIKALETAAGQVLVQRSVPVLPTDAGQVLLTMARQVEVLDAEARAGLAGAAGPRVRLRVAVNADTLATWFVGVLAEAAGWDDCVLHLEVEDQEHSADLLRRAAVMAAVTADPAPVSGCRVERLGSMRYVPVAASGLLARLGMTGAVDWSALPVVQFNRKDTLQLDVLRRADAGEPPAAQVPSSEGFVAAVRAGLGWGMVPEGQLGDTLDSGELVRLPTPTRDVELYWQAWRLASPRLDRLSAAVRRAARGLR